MINDVCKYIDNNSVIGIFEWCMSMRVSILTCRSHMIDIMGPIVQPYVCQSPIDWRGGQYLIGSIFKWHALCQDKVSDSFNSSCCDKLNIYGILAVLLGKEDELYKMDK